MQILYALLLTDLIFPYFILNFPLSNHFPIVKLNKSVMLSRMNYQLLLQQQQQQHDQINNVDGNNKITQ